MKQLWFRFCFWITNHWFEICPKCSCPQFAPAEQNDRHDFYWCLECGYEWRISNRYGFSLLGDDYRPFWFQVAPERFRAYCAQLHYQRWRIGQLVASQQRRRQSLQDTIAWAKDREERLARRAARDRASC